MLSRDVDHLSYPLSVPLALDVISGLDLVLMGPPCNQHKAVFFFLSSHFKMIERIALGPFFMGGGA